MQSLPVVVFALCLSLGSCESSGRDLRGRDYRTVLPAIRTIIDLRGSTSDAANQPIIELEFDLAGADGDMHTGGTVTGEYRLVEGGAAIRLGRQMRDKVRLVGIMGFAINRIDLVDGSGFPTIDDHTTHPGFRLGGEVRVRVTDWLWGHGRFVGFVRPWDLIATQAEIGFLFGRPDEMGLMIGYKDWRYEDESSHLSGVDDVDLQVNGLFVAMELHF